MIPVFIVTIILVFACVLLLGVKVFFTKNGTFPNVHIGNNSKLQGKGISCAHSMDARERNRQNLLDRINNA